MTEGQKANVSINEWLSSNRLTKFKQYFEENEVITDDLLEYTEDDMNSVIKDVKITASVYIKRFKDSVRKLQYKHTKKHSHQNNFNYVYRTIISSKESQSMKIIEDKLSTIDVALQNNINLTNKSIQNTSNIENSIKSLFNIFKNKLVEREKLLITNLNNESNKILNTLKNQKNILSKYKVSFQQTLKEQNALILDPNIDTKKRENKINTLTNNAIQNASNNDMNISINPISFTVNDKSVNKYISSIGSITDGLILEVPILSTINVTTATVMFKLECKGNVDIKACNVKYVNGNFSDNDDEKKELKQMNIQNKNNNQYTVINLKENSNYEISAQYTISSDNIWSAWSNKMSFKTKKQLKEEWDVNNIGDGIIVDTITATANFTYTKWAWRTLYGKRVVTKGKHEWKFKISKANSSSLVFGIVPSTNKRNTFSWESKSNNNQYYYNYAFGTGDGRFSKIHPNFQWKSDDNLVMLLDLTKKSLKYIISGKTIIVMDKCNLSNAQYRLAVCNIGKDTQIQLLSYRSL